ncbi:AHH domain-containing protein [Capnocytophaga cynodegmi]|uniref:AHH domain-containing protein n=1 Tax=Capnocytophaga cynodegmi TaxID=28189 RepID=UPI00385FF1B1
MGSDYQLSDASGKTWTLDEKGEVTSVGEKADTKLAQNQGKNNLPKGQSKPENFEVQWDFSQSAFAFDASGEIPYKALVKGKNDVFQVVIKQKDSLRYSFHFQTDKGLKVESKKEKEGVFEISRKGLFDFGDEELWVVAQNTKTEKEEVIGKCMLVHLSEKEVNVTLIPTTENLQIGIDAIQQIYAKVGVKLHISTDEIFPIKEKIDTKNAFGDLSTYSPEQQAIIAWYKSEREVKSDTYYVFVGKQEGSQVGYMRLGGQFGFALDGNSRTIAHELGHGIFRLEHPFKKDVTKKGTFRTLMDYAQETTFAYSDWKQINDPALKIGFFGGQSEGALQQDEDILLRIAQAMQGLGGKAFLKCKECESESKKIEQNLEGEIITIDINTKKYYKCILGEHKNGAISFGIKGLNKNLSTQYDKTTLTEYYEKFSSVIKANTQQDFLLVGDNQSVTKCDVPLQFSDSFCGYTQGSQINKEDKTYIAGELENCFENNLIALEKQLVIVKSQLRKDQNVEWEHGGKVYRLNADNQIEEVQNVLSDQDIIAGNWTGEQEQKLRFYRDEKGTIQLKAFGYRKDLRIVKDKTADLEAVSKHILQQTNVYFKNLKDITQKAPQINDESFADGRKIAIDKDATYIRIFSEGVGITKTLLKTGEVESNVYLDKPKEKAFIKVPGTATGSVEAGVMAVTDITGTVVIIYDLATDETARKETYEGLVKIKDEIKENPSELFLILADVILEEATGLSADDWQKTQAQQTDKGEKSHLYSKGAVRSTITAVASGKLIAKLPKMADDLVVKMKKAKVKKLVPSLKRLDVAGEFAKGKKLVEQTIKWGENQITLKWKRVGNKIDFGNRRDLATILGTTDNIEAHHILPWKICENDIVIQKAAMDGFHPNMLENGLGLEKYTKLIENGMHGNHPAYDNYVRTKLEDFMLENPKITPEQANKFLQEELIPDLKTKIIEAQNSGLNLNEYFKTITN